ncbi:MAP9 protein, partial [Turnix velox]|nr:MAP9 protein [Turnix velox]
INISDLKLEDNSRESSSVTEATMMTVYEKTKKGVSTDGDSHEMVVEEQIVADAIQKVSVNDKSQHEEAKNTSEGSGKVLFLSLPSARLKKKAKAVPSVTPISSQYMGTLKVLEDKSVQNNSTEFEKADSLRAAVFQNWLEKKRVIQLELKRIEKKKAEDLRNSAEKKEAVKREEAIASFEAWKKKKGREAKKLTEKKKVEELKKKKVAEENEEKTEAAQKSDDLLFSLCRNEKKEEYMRKKKVEKILEKKKQEIQQAKKEEKDKKAMEEYERWLEKKLKREQLDKKQKTLRAVHRDGAPSPWSPPGKVTY